MTKICEICGESFSKPRKYSYRQWATRRFCSHRCMGVAKRTGRIRADGRVEIWDGNRRRFRYHVVAEQMLGRSLEVGEVVDHVNGDASDDRPENLRVFSSNGEHLAAHWAEGTLTSDRFGGSESWPKARVPLAA